MGVDFPTTLYPTVQYALVYAEIQDSNHSRRSEYPNNIMCQVIAISWTEHGISFCHTIWLFLPWMMAGATYSLVQVLLDSDPSDASIIVFVCLLSHGLLGCNHYTQLWQNSICIRWPAKKIQQVECAVLPRDHQIVVVLKGEPVPCTKYKVGAIALTSTWTARYHLFDTCA